MSGLVEVAYLLLQIDVTPLIKTWGAGGVILVAIGLFIWKWALPRVDGVIAAWTKRKQDERDRVQKRDEQFIQMISDNLADAQRNRAMERDKFLEVVDGSIKRQTEVLTSLTVAVNKSLERKDR